MSLNSAAPGEWVAGSSRRSNVALTSAAVSGRPSAKCRPASSWTRNVRLPREMTGRSRARPGTITVPGRPSASA